MNTGAKWWKFDFHAHTPASFDYVNSNNITPKDWLLKCMSQKIDCVAITDHNNGEFIDKVREVYQSLNKYASYFRELYIFPGVEITVQGGVHILAILDISKTSSDIATLLGACGYTGELGQSGTCTSKSITDVIKIISESGAIAVPAHINENKGLFTKITDGNTLKTILNHPKLYVAEITDSTYINSHNNNSLPELYNSEKTNWSFIFGSDSHKLDEIGRRWTWIKMGYPSLEGLKLALLDGDLSIKRSDEYTENPNTFPALFIKNLQIKDAQYCGNGIPLEIEFSPWLNCIIGGRGSGKSTIIEFLRIVYRRTEELDFNRKLEENFYDFFRIPANREQKGVLREQTQIISNLLKDETSFLLQWSQDSSLKPILVKNTLNQFIISEGDIFSRFPIRIYSQKQIFEMANSPEALLHIIDDSPDINYPEWKEKFDQLCAEYRSIKSKIRELNTYITNEANIIGTLEDIKKKISILEKNKKSDILKKYQKTRNEKKEILAFQESIQANVDSLKNISIELITPNKKIIDDSNDAEELQKIIDKFTSLSTDYNNQLNSIKTNLISINEKFQTEISKSQWQVNTKQIKTEYASFVEELKKLGIHNPNEYDLLIQSKLNAETKLKKINYYKKNQEDLQKEADAILVKILKQRTLLTKKRKKFLDKILSNNPFIKIEIIECGNTKNLEIEFRNLINREAGFNDDISDILKKLDNNFTYDSLKKMKDTIKKINSEKTERIPRDKRFHSYIQEKMTDEMLDNLDLWFPQDAVQISYSRDNTFVPIEQGSPGQKTAAILAFILSYGNEPIILDQPEDDLDNHLITDLVVNQIRANKNRRQIIIVTHNPNIVVNGDAEKLIALDFRNGQIQISSDGCLQDRNIRKEICTIMEGGKDALKQRYRRINIEGV